MEGVSGEGRREGGRRRRRREEGGVLENLPAVVGFETVGSSEHL